VCLTANPVAEEFTEYCIEFYEQFAARTGYDPDFRQVGSLRMALTPRWQDELRVLQAVAERRGDAAPMLDAAAVGELVPGLVVPDGAAVMHIPRDGYVDPAAAAIGFAAAARDRGVGLLDHVRVTGVSIDHGAVTGVTTEHGAISAPWVVMAVGAWTRSLLGTAGVDVGSVPVRHQALVTVPMPSVRPDQPVVRITEPQVYARPMGGGLLVGGYGYGPTTFDLSDAPPDFAVTDVGPDPAAFAELRATAARFFPALDDAAIVQERLGLPTVTPDSRPIVSPLDAGRGLVVATGCQVSGITTAPGVGRLVTQYVCDEPRWAYADELRADRIDTTDDAALRAACQDAYARLYWGVH
jgi:glycine/D-amino acid oxidase-like deaminating enzyme